MGSKNFIIIVLGIFLATALGFCGYLYFGQNKIALDNSYKAIFLDNGQVYFGMVSSRNTQFVQIKNTYYLQSKDLVGNEANSGDISLVKVGNELHGPKDTMEVNYDHILFIQDLKDDSKILKAILKKN